MCACVYDSNSDSNSNTNTFFLNTSIILKRVINHSLIPNKKIEIE